MPLPSRWMIRCSLIYMVIGFIIGALLLANKAYPFFPEVWTLLTVHIEISIFGWIIQLTMGTAYWILPRFLKGEPRGNTGLSKTMVIMLNAGILINVGGYLYLFPDAAILVGRTLEVGSVLIFGGLHWNRAVSYN